MGNDKHLLFYDGSCGLCDRAVQFVLQADTEGIFRFAPLQGTTAKELLGDLPDELKTIDSLILVESYQTSTRCISTHAKGALRVLWLLGGGYRVIGCLSFLPGWLFDWAYRLVARNRHHLFSTSCPAPTSSNRDRFLP